MIEVETEVRRQLVCLGDELRGKRARNAVWTAQLKENMEDGAKRLGYDVCATGCERGEWLYDVIWLRQQDGRLLSVPLALESEWSGDDAAIYYDFEKLLLARASLRVMVFEGNTAERTDRVIASLRGRIEAFDQSREGDAYMFASWEGGRAFRFERHTVADSRTRT